MRALEKRPAPFSLKQQTGFATIAIVCFLLLYTPIVTLVIYSFNAGKYIAIWEGFSFQWYVSAWNNEAVQDAAIQLPGLGDAGLGIFDRPGHHGGPRHHAHPVLSRFDRGLCHDQPAAHGAGDRNRGSRFSSSSP